MCRARLFMALTPVPAPIRDIDPDEYSRKGLLSDAEYRAKREEILGEG